MLRPRTLVSMLFALVLLLAASGTAQAAPWSAAGGKGAEAETCVTVLAPLRAGQTASDVLSSSCGGDAASRSSLTAYSTLLGIEYDGSSFSGAAWYVYGGGGACSAGASYGWESIGGWNDRISSARTYNGCTSRHYDGYSYTGSSWWCYCTSMGSMSNRTSSIVFS